MRRLPSIFDSFSRFDRTFSLLSTRFDDVFGKFFDELYVDPEVVQEYKGERHTFINGMLVKIEKSDGTVEHYQNGKLHNAAGPAVENKKTDQVEYWLDGKVVSKTDHDQYIKKIEESKTSEYQLELTSSEREKIEGILGRKLK